MPQQIRACLAVRDESSDGIRRAMHPRGRRCSFLKYGLDILGRRALPTGRLARLGARRYFHHELLAIGLVIAPLALLAVACSRPQEQQYLNQFFRAARARDNSTLAMMSAVEFDPREQGEVVDFEITNVTEERRTPLDFQALIDAERKAVTEQADFLKRKIEYQNANLPALEAIVKMERDPNAKFTPAQQSMKAEWDKWRADTTMHQKAVAAAKSAMTASTGPAEASLTQPGQPPFSADKFQGNLVSKDVTLNAQVRTPDGQTSNKTLVVTIQRVEGTLGGAQRTGRPIITNIQGA